MLIHFFLFKNIKQQSCKVYCLPSYIIIYYYDKWIKLSLYLLCAIQTNSYLCLLNKSKILLNLLDSISHIFCFNSHSFDFSDFSSKSFVVVSIICRCCSNWLNFSNCPKIFVVVVSSSLFLQLHKIDIIIIINTYYMWE